MLIFDSCIMNVNVNSTTRTELQPNFLSISFGPLPNKRYLAKKHFFLLLRTQDIFKLTSLAPIPLFSQVKRVFWGVNVDSPKTWSYRKNRHCELFDSSKILILRKVLISENFGDWINVFVSNKGFILSKNILCFSRSNHSCKYSRFSNLVITVYLSFKNRWFLLTWLEKINRCDAS